ncbi:MAG: DUF167 domain-containing protein [Nanoarchaeota archaeon]
MDIIPFIKNKTIAVKVIPSSGRNEIKEENGKLKVYLKSPPDKNKANAELIKFFKKSFNLSVSIKFGKTSRDKVLEIG